MLTAAYAAIIRDARDSLQRANPIDGNGPHREHSKSIPARCSPRGASDRLVCMSDSNQATLQSYEQCSQAYIDGTTHQPAPSTRRWINTALHGLPSSARILEIGSGFGRDAAYIAAVGYTVACTDAAQSFVDALLARGFTASRLNLLTDPVPGDQDLIIANAVLLHFTPGECALALGKLQSALAEGARLAISLKAGDGEEWSSAKLGAPRYFCYWRPEPLCAVLEQAGFTDIHIEATATDRAHADWLYVLAR
jgi:SAM-dependent methyltransferase